jgi:DNA repair protein RecO (recombination protein O)
MADVAIQKTDAIILRRYPLRETSLLLFFYTKDFGKIKGVIRGIRGPRGQFGSFPEIFTLNKIVFYASRKREYVYLTECDLVDLFKNIRLDLERTGYASYIIEMVDATSMFHDTNKVLFQLLVDSLHALCGPGSARRIARIFEIKLLLILGLMPAVDRCLQCGKAVNSGTRFSFKLGGLLCRNCDAADRAAVDILPGTINFIYHIEKASYQKATRVKVSKQVGEEVESILRKFLDIHIDKKLKTLDFLKKIEVGN